MRVGVLVTGILLFVLGVATFVGGASLYGVGDACLREGSCFGDEREAALAMREVGRPLQMGGGLLVAGGVAVGVVGAVANKPAARSVPVRADITCGDCGERAPSGSRFCPQCGRTLAISATA